MEISVKKAAKVAGAVCAATGIVALSALVASGAAVGAVVEGFKTANSTAKKLLADEAKKETPAADETEKETLATDETEKETPVDEQQGGEQL